MMNAVQCLEAHISVWFLPPPIPLLQTYEGLKSGERSNNDIHQFPSLFVAMVLKFDEMLPRSAKTFKILLYDLYCPSVQACLQERICKVCHVYFASQVMLKNHVVHHRQVTNSTTTMEIKRIRPLRVAAR